jgi:hypothetical protein
MKQQRRKKRARSGDPQRITKAVTQIRLIEVNPGKLAALDALAPAYLALCQQYVTLFCTQEAPDKLRAPCYPTPLSERWQRVAIQQAAGIAQSWRTNRAQAYEQYQQDLARYQQRAAEGTTTTKDTEPQWREWNIPTLRQPCIQANVNVVRLEASTDSSFDYWLLISTLCKGQPSPCRLNWPPTTVSNSPTPRPTREEHSTAVCNSTNGRVSGGSPSLTTRKSPYRRRPMHRSWG